MAKFSISTYAVSHYAENDHMLMVCTGTILSTHIGPLNYSSVYAYMLLGQQCNAPG